MDPLSLLAGGALLVIGWVAGRLGRVRPRPHRQPQPVCGCGHHLAHHDRQAGACAALVLYEWYDKRMMQRWETCSCKRYTGPEPIDPGTWVAPMTITEG